MKRQMYTMVAVLIAVTSIGQIDALGAKRGPKKVVESPAAQVNKEVSVLDQVVEQARIIVQATGSKAHKTRATAKIELTKLMKQLDSSVRDLISDDIDTIKATGKTADSKKEAQDAYERLIAAVNSMNAQANVVMTMEEGRNAIDRAPADMKKAVVAEQMQNVAIAKEEAAKASMMQRVIANVREGFNNSVDYIFGKEASKAEIALKAAIGAVVVTGAAYAAYKLTPETIGIKASGRKIWAKGKKALGKELTLEEKVALDEPLKLRENYGYNKLRAQRSGSWYSSSNQPELEKSRSWYSSFNQPTEVSAPSYWQQTKDFFNKKMYGTTAAERKNAAEWANLEPYTTE